jgi:hypothetical protein
MNIKKGIIILIIVLIISIIFIRKEAFTNYDSINNINISTCPFNSTPHLFKGDTICCKSTSKFNDIVGCIDDKPVCSLSSNGADSCGAIYRKYLSEEALKFCPKGMPSYYEKTDGKMHCYGGPSKQDGTAPMEQGQPQCPVYKNENDFSDSKSCYNLKKLDDLPCLTKELCEKNIIPTRGWGEEKTPSLITQSYMSTNKMIGGSIMKVPRTCYYDDSVIKYLNVVFPRWKEMFKLENHDFVCSTADAMYVKMTKPVK